MGGRRQRGRGRGKKTDADLFLSSSDLSTDSSLSPACSMSKLSMVELLPSQPRVTGLFPGKSTTGRPCTIETNHFTISLKIPEGMIYMYDVTVEPPWQRPYTVWPSRSLFLGQVPIGTISHIWVSIWSLF